MDRYAHIHMCTYISVFVCTCVCVQDKLSGKLDTGLEGMLPMVLEMQSKLAFIESKHHTHASL